MKKLEFPKAFEDILKKHLKTFYGKKSFQDFPWNQKDFSYFTKGVSLLNESFTTGRSQTNQNYFLDPILRSGYLAYFLPVNAMKAFHIFSEINPKISNNEIKILDIGSGPLTLTLGYLFFLEKKLQKKKGVFEIQIHAVEQNEKILKDGITLIENWIQNSRIHNKVKLKIFSHVKNALNFKITKKNFDIVLIGNFLNEIQTRDHQQKSILNILKFYTHKASQFFIIEPALKKVSRDLQALRDEVLLKTNFQVIAPCLHQEKCSLNVENKSDWCHFLKPWATPLWIQNFDKATGLKKNNLMYSYVFFENNAKPKQAPQSFLAISNTMKAKGRLELVGCGTLGLARFIKSNKNHSDSNKEFDTIHRGQYFEYSDLNEKDFSYDKIVNVGKNHKFVLKP